MQNNASVLDVNDVRCLRCVAGMMIPASTVHGVPGANDDTIFADIVDSLGMDAALVKQALQRLNELADGLFADQDPARRQAATMAFQHEGGARLAALTRVVVQCYYRDDRVMHALGMEVRPAFPKGFEVEQGNWSLLDPVRARAPFYRRIA